MRNALTIFFLGALLSLAWAMPRRENHRPRLIVPAANAFAGYGPGNPQELACGEYYHLCRRNDSVFDMAQGKVVYLTNNAIHIFCGAHNAGYIDAGHRAWIEGSNGSGEQGTGNTGGGNNVYGFQEILTDSSGTVQLHFSDIQFGQTHTAYGATQSFWFGAGISSDDSTVWAWGMLYGGRCGNGTGCSMRTISPVKCNLPGGEKAVQICVSWTIVVRCLSGNVYTWGGGDGGVDGSVLGQGASPNYFTPTLISLPAPARLIAGGGLWSYAVLNNDSLYMWGSVNHSLYQTLSSGSTRVPKNISGNLGFAFTGSAHKITDIKTNDGATYCITADGLLHDWGGRDQGQLGDGTEIDYSRYGGYPLPYGTGYPPASPFYYHYDQGYNETGAGTSVVIQVSPINPTPGKSNYVHIYTSNCGYCYQVWFVDANGNVYFCGRDKGSCPDGFMPWDYVAGNTQADAPNSWDRKYMKQVFVFNVSHIYSSPTPDCLPSGAHLYTDACALYSPGSHSAATARVALSVVYIGGHPALIIDNTGSGGADSLMNTINYQAAGPVTLDMGVEDQRIDTVTTAGGSFLTPGQTFTIHSTIINNYFDSAVASASITIPPLGCGNCLTGPNQIILHASNSHYEKASLFADLLGPFTGGSADPLFANNVQRGKSPSR